MLIKKLILSQYKRLMLSNIQYFEYTPNRPMQLIIGSNGSGKSSVLDELTPVPAHHSGFTKGGRKVVEVEHRGEHYLLTSEYNHGSGNHSFIKNHTDELNKGGTFAIQKDLVYQTFGLTREIHEILTGLTPFTGLSTAKRREWLTRLTPVDMDYAFGLYQTVKSLHRDQLGVIKHLAKRMGRENHDLPDDSEIAGLRKQIESLSNKYEELFALRRTGVKSHFTSEEDARVRLEGLLARAKRLLNTYPSIPSWLQVKDAQGFSEAFAQIKESRSSAQAILERLLDEHQQLLDASPARDVDLTDAQIAELRQEIIVFARKEREHQAQVDTYRGRLPLVQAEAAPFTVDTLNSIYGEWLKLLSTFPDNADGQYSTARGQAAKEDAKTQELQRRSLESRQTSLAQRLSRLRGCETVECPQCTHSFTPGVNPKEITQIEAELSQIDVQLQGLNKSIAELEDYIERFDDYLSYVRAFRRLVTESNQHLAPLWEYCVAERVMFVSPKHYITDAQQWHTAMTEYLALRDCITQREVLTHRLRYVEAIDRDSVGQLDRKRKALEVEIEQQTERVRQYTQQIRLLEQTQTGIEQHTRDLTQLVQEFEQHHAYIGEQREYLFQKAVNDESVQTQLSMAQIQDRLTKIDMREALLNDIQKQHDQAVNTHKELGLIVKALAPTDGLIGRYLMGFMQQVVQLINSVIAEIWTYPLEVLPSRLEKDELDYRFPLESNNGAVTAPDISLGSSSQRDIVNFAFKLLVMKFLRLEDCPLYLDEFGSTFDEQHRENTIPFITRMLELGQVHQIFYISHYSSTHGAFNQAEICVLDDANVTVPVTYNQHVKMR